MFIRIASQPLKAPVKKAAQELEQAINTQTPAKLTESSGPAVAPQKLLTVRNVQLAGGAAIAGLAVLECSGVIPRALILPAFDALKASGLPERASALAGQCLTRGSNLLDSGAKVGLAAAKGGRDILLERWNENRFKWVTNQIKKNCDGVVEAKKALAKHFEEEVHTNAWNAKLDALKDAIKFAEKRCTMACELPNPFAPARQVVSSESRALPVPGYSSLFSEYSSLFFSGLKNMNYVFATFNNVVKCSSYIKSLA